MRWPSCVSICSGRGVLLAECEDAVCLRQRGPCVKGANADLIDVGTLCFTDERTPGCETACNAATGQIVSLTCNAGGACVPLATQECAPYACDPNTMECHDQCIEGSECVEGYFCFQQLCG